MIVRSSFFALVIVAWCGVSSAQCDPGGGMGGMGPDAVVGDLTSPISYGSAGGYYAYSLGTVCCNIGTGLLDWIASTNDHPVIAQNMYRLRDGRFEQIGMSWLKHGFGALQQNACGCGCTPSGAFNRLGIGCSDPYTASTNGNQGGLGPRSEVIDPANGTFIYPPIIQPVIQNLTWRRLKVHGPDLDPALNSGALYFAEVQYITPDDAVAGNAHNNASYRPISISPDPTSFSISFAGPTQRQQPGIQAWQDADPSVSLVDIPDGAGGLFILGSKVTPIGSTGLYGYEYALYNMNSTRAAQSVEIPLPPGVVAMNLGFHDAQYHSGDPFSSVDWAMSNATGTAAWSTETAAQNPDANALRWGSIYNYRFVAAAPPGPSTMTIGLFESGTPASLTVAVDGPGDSVLDCNGNGTLDIDEIASGAPDCDENGLLDECQADCDGDGAADSCEILAGTETDCDLDGIPDGCQIASGAVDDCDGDGVPDPCQIAFGTGTDCDLDGVLDACNPIAGDDCNGNGVADACDLASGSSFDADGDGIPNECDTIPFVRGDANADGTVDLADPIRVFDYIFGGIPVACQLPLDANTDTAIDVADGVWILTHLFAGGPPPSAPYPGCGPDPASPLSCVEYAPCP